MAKRLRKEEQIMPDIRILTEGDSSVLVEFGKEISPEINRKIRAFKIAYERTAYRGSCRYDPCVLFFAG